MGWKPIAVAAAILVLGILPVSAQVRGSAGGRVAVARSASVPSRPVGTVRTATVQPSAAHPHGRRVTGGTPVGVTPFVGPGFFPSGTLQDLFGFPTPGLGFDYSHLAAINSGLGVRALIDPVTQQEIALALRLSGAGTGFFPGYYAPYGGVPMVMESPGAASAPVADSAPQQPQPIYVITPPSTAAQAPEVEQSPLPDPGEFVLVQRDGRLLFAVAFTSSDGRVVYVTKEGVRRSIPLSQLDLDSTQRMNEERGTSVQLPAA